MHVYFFDALKTEDLIMELARNPPSQMRKFRKSSKKR